MTSEKAPLLSSPPMLDQTLPPPEESAASKALFINDPIDMEGGQGGEGPSSQKWEMVIAYPNISTNTFTSPEQKRVHERREALVGQLREVGLFVSQREANDSANTFLLVGASHAKLEEYAEMIGLELNLKVEYGGGFSKFTTKKKHLFKVLGPDGLFTKTERQRMLIQIIESDKDEGGAELDLRGMEFEGVITKVYPLHENSVKKKLIDDYCKNKHPLTPMPLDDIRKYFGEEVSFYFAWLAFYTRWLMYASIVGIVATIIWVSADLSGLAENNWANAIYSIFIAVWATMFLEFWKRERNLRAYQWNMLDYENVEIIRPGFMGEEQTGVYSKGVFITLRKDEVYGNSPPKPIKNFPIATTHKRMAIGLSLILTLCLVVGIATFAVFTFRILVQNSKTFTTYSSVVGGILNAIVIMIMNKVYRFVAVKLNDWENHRTESNYTDNLLWKIFLFQFVNSYTSLYYIAFFKRNAHLWGTSTFADSCGDEKDDKPINEFTIGCPNQLFIQLLTLLGTNIAVGQAQEVLLPYIIAKAKLYWLQRQSQRDESDIPKYEREFQLNQFEGMIDEYAEMVVQYGYITLFASAVPIAPALAFINNVVEMRTDTFKWLTSYNKPFYRGADDIGGWYTILQVVGVIAVITNILLLLFSFPTLYSIGHNTRYEVLWIVVILEHVIFLVQYVVAVTVPDVPSEIRENLAKQYYIQQQLIKKYEKKLKKRSDRDKEESVYMRKEMDNIERYDESRD